MVCSCITCAFFSVRKRIGGKGNGKLIAALGMKNPLYAEIVRLGYQGLGRKEIVDSLPVRKSQGYEVYKRCREEAEKWLNL